METDFPAGEGNKNKSWKDFLTFKNLNFDTKENNKKFIF